MEKKKKRRKKKRTIQEHDKKKSAYTDTFKSHSNIYIYGIYTVKMELRQQDELNIVILASGGSFIALR